jgi:hypothetical protein
MNIYLDINGTLLTKDLVPAKHLHRFIRNAVENHTVFWLTGHCKGNATEAFSYISQFVPSETREYFAKILPTRWKVLKIEAIDFTTDFLWFDDYILFYEKSELKKRKKLPSLVNVNLDTDPEILGRYLDI